MRSNQASLVRYLVTFGAGTFVGQAILASTAIQASVVVPFARWQGALVQHFVLDGPLGVSVDPSCSGLEVIALCIAGTLAYPVAWRKRLTGAAVGVMLMLILNVVRIAMLAGTSQSPWFRTFHEHVWPTVLVVVAAAWILVWMRSTDRTTRAVPVASNPFVVWSVAMLIVYAVAVTVLTEAGVLDRAARGAAHVAAGTLTQFGAAASVNQRVLSVGQMQYLITPECVTTPLIALYFAALFALPMGWSTRVAGVVASVPVFAGLAVLRLLTVALPFAAAGTTLILTHAFNQILIGLVFLVTVSLWWRETGTRQRAVAVALAAGFGATVISIATGLAVAMMWTRLLQAVSFAVPPGLTSPVSAGDGQGALVILPVYQLTLFAAAWVVRTAVVGHPTHTRWIFGGAALSCSQLLFLALQGWMFEEGIRPFSALVIRGWAVLVPVLLAMIVVRARPVPTSTAVESPRVSTA